MVLELSTALPYELSGCFSISLWVIELGLLGCLSLFGLYVRYVYVYVRVKYKYKHKYEQK